MAHSIYDHEFTMNVHEFKQCVVAGDEKHACKNSKLLLILC